MYIHSLPKFWAETQENQLIYKKRAQKNAIPQLYKVTEVLHYLRPNIYKLTDHLDFGPKILVNCVIHSLPKFWTQNSIRALVLQKRPKKNEAKNLKLFSVHFSQKRPSLYSFFTKYRKSSSTTKV